MKLLALVGSPRKKGNTNVVVDKALAEVSGQGIDTEKIMISEHEINPCQGHDDCPDFKRCQYQDDLPGIYEKVDEADGVILATPVYWMNVTAQLKTFIDRAYFYYQKKHIFRPKTVGFIIIGRGGGRKETLTTLNQYVDYAFDVPKKNRLSMLGWASHVGDAAKDNGLIQQAKDFGKTIAAKLQ